MLEPEDSSATTERLFAGLACGQLPLEMVSVRFSVSEYFRNVLAAFLIKYEAAIERCSSGVIDVLHTVRSTEDDIYDVCWDPSFGSLLAALQHPDRPELPRRISAIVLRLAELGMSMNCRIVLDDAANLRIGRYLLEDILVLSVNSADGNCTIQWRTGSGQHSELQFDRNGPETCAGVRQLREVIGPSPSWLILDPKLVATTEFRGNHTNYDRKPPDQFARQCNSALSLIERHTPSYLSWTQSVIRCVVPLNAETAGNLLGGSVKTAPGTIHITHSPDAVDLADMLIHEAAHQYFHIGAKLGSYTDGSDPKTYFSPFVKADRPIDKILMTFHAFGNACLLYFALVQNSEKYRGQHLHKLRHMLEYIDIVDGYLSRSDSLTCLGITLYSSLRRQIQDRRISLSLT